MERTPHQAEVPGPPDPYPQTALSQRVTGYFQHLAGAVAAIWLLLIAVVMVNVAMRYLLGDGRIAFEEIQWHLYGTGFMLGLALCMDSDQHIRVDVFHERMGPRTKAWIELYGLLLLFLPFVLTMLWFSLPFVAYSFDSAEVSDAAGGLPLRWLIKSVLPISMLLLLTAGVSRLSRVLALLFGWPKRVD